MRDGDKSVSARARAKAVIERRVWESVRHRSGTRQLANLARMSPVTWGC